MAYFYFYPWWQKLIKRSIYLVVGHGGRVLQSAVTEIISSVYVQFSPSTACPTWVLHFRNWVAREAILIQISEPNQGLKQTQKRFQISSPFRPCFEANSALNNTKRALFAVSYQYHINPIQPLCFPN